MQKLQGFNFFIRLSVGCNLEVDLDKRFGLLWEKEGPSMDGYWDGFGSHLKSGCKEGFRKLGITTFKICNIFI